VACQPCSCPFPACLHHRIGGLAPEQRAKAASHLSHIPSCYRLSMRLWSRPSYRLNMLLGLVVTLAATCKVHAYVPAYASSNPDPVAIAPTDGNSTGKLYPTDTLVLTSFKSPACVYHSSVKSSPYLCACDRVIIGQAQRLDSYI
jgi:hypothetical protein